jgi:uncharacterized protein YegL
MSYNHEISRNFPGCIVFLLDQSGSMNETFAGTTETKAKGAADAINNIIRELILKCKKEPTPDNPSGIRDYFDVAIIGYGSQANPLIGQQFIKIKDLNDKPLRIEDRLKREPDGVGGIMESKVSIPIWFDPTAQGMTVMCEALKLAYEWLKTWITTHEENFPPIIINITDGEATDDKPVPFAKQVTDLKTKDGNVLMFNCHISVSNNAKMVFAKDLDALKSDELATQLFEMSSQLPPQMLGLAEQQGFHVSQGSRGFAFNADLVDLIRFLDIGTRVAIDKMTAS